MTVVELVGAARAELGLFPISTTVLSSGQQIDQQMLALANLLGRELQQENTWTALQTQYIVTTRVIVQTVGTVAQGSGIITAIPDTSAFAANTWVVSGAGLVISTRVIAVGPNDVAIDQLGTSNEVLTPLTFSQDTYTLPPDIGSFVSDTWWDRTNRWALIGPTSPQMDQFLRSGIVTTTPRRNWRQVGRPSNNWRIWPPPGSTDPALTLEFEYDSTYWATDQDGQPKAAFTADTDTCVFPDALMIAGLKLKFFQAKGMDTTDLAGTYAALLATAKANDGGATKLSMSGEMAAPVLIGYWNIPDGNFPRPQ